MHRGGGKLSRARKASAEARRPENAGRVRGATRRLPVWLEGSEEGRGLGETAEGGQS